MRYKIEIEYDGSGFSGWQLQKNAKTVQGELEKALKIIYKEEIRVHGAGRTDSGVHARGQAAHFDVPHQDLGEHKILTALNALTPAQVAVTGIKKVSDDFHARFSAKWRRYRYFIASRPVALDRKFVWYVPFKLDDEKIRSFCDIVKEQTDFQSFAKYGDSLEHYLCRIHSVRWFKNEKGYDVFEIKANRFLHGMVRTLVGTAVMVGRGKIFLDEVSEIFAAKDRKAAPMAAPARGLVLEEVEY